MTGDGVFGCTYLNWRGLRDVVSGRQGARVAGEFLGVLIIVGCSAGGTVEGVYAEARRLPLMFRQLSHRCTLVSSRLEVVTVQEALGRSGAEALGVR